MTHSKEKSKSTETEISPEKDLVADKLDGP